MDGSVGDAALLDIAGDVGLGPGTVVRGATFDCGLLVVVVVDVLLAALLLLEGEPHPTTPMPKAVMAIATPLIAAIRFIE